MDTTHARRSAQSASRQASQRPAEHGLTVELERTRFTSLLLENPNYFGNVETSPFPPVKVIQGNTTFEQLVCVGLTRPTTGSRA